MSSRYVQGVKSLVILPTYNERENLFDLSRALLTVRPDVDILIVDDASPDGTGVLADSLAAECPRISVMHREGKLGLGTAYVAGFRHALAGPYDLVVQMDADFSHHPNDLGRLLDAADDADVVVGSRCVPGGVTPGWSVLRTLLSRGGSMYARAVLTLPLLDCTSGFKCFRRTALEAIDLSALRSRGFSFQLEVNHACARAGLRFAEVPITFCDRTRGESKMSLRIVMEALSVVAQLRLAAPHEAGPGGLGLAERGLREPVAGMRIVNRAKVVAVPSVASTEAERPSHTIAKAA